jgi:cell division protein ZapA
MSELIAISALIGDRTYRIKVESKDEEVVRRTLKTINDKIIEFKTAFTGKDMQDYIAMVMIWYATQAPAVTAGEAEKNEFLQGLQSLEKLIDAQLSE